MDLPVLDEVSGDEALLKGRIMVAWDKDLVRNLKRGKPVDESTELGLVAIGILVVRRVAAVDHHVNTGRYREEAVLHVRV